MRDYILTLTLISVFCGIIHILSPMGEGGGLKGNVRLISALAVLCVALFPIGDFLIQLRDRDLSFSEDAPEDLLGEEYEGELCDAMMEYSGESVARICEKMLAEKFDIDEKDISIVIFSYVENDKIKVERADLEIHIGAITEPPEPLKAALEELLDVECRIIYK